jgi:glycosyltransferase involved in cell wall biosynthesis
VVTDGEEGFLVEPGDIPGMARRALEILTRETLAERMAQNGRRKALERFCAARIIPMYEAHYLKVLESA